jgi:hypothetical protein
MHPATRLLIAVAVSTSSPFRAQEGIAALAHAGREPELPTTPPVIARPDFVIRDGGISAGSFGKIVATRAFNLPADMRSSFEASLSFDSPGERAVTPAFRKGLVRVSLQTASGVQGALGLWGDPQDADVERQRRRCAARVDPPERGGHVELGAPRMG